MEKADATGNSASSLGDGEWAEIECSGTFLARGKLVMVCKVLFSLCSVILVCYRLF